MKLVGHLSSLHWPGEVLDLGVGAVSYAGTFLLCHASRLKKQLPSRIRLVDIWPLLMFLRDGLAPIWMACRFLGSMLRALVNCLVRLATVCPVILVLITGGFDDQVGNIRIFRNNENNINYHYNYDKSKNYQYQYPYQYQYNLQPPTSNPLLVTYDLLIPDY